MALRDSACYTLSIEASKKDPNIVELVEVGSNDGKGNPEVRYVRVREPKEGESYSGVIYDAYSGAKLGSMGYAHQKDKNRRLELHNPDAVVSFENTGRIGFEWTFEFEGNKYRWSREVYGRDYICALDRKPDPKVEICLARDADKNGPGRLQILHYNIDRFPNEIKDLRGLETLLVASLMVFVDAADERSGSRNTLQRPSISSNGSGSSTTVPPPIPPKPEKLISIEDFEPENPNEIVIGTRSDIDASVARAVGLLEDKQTLFIVLRTRDSAASKLALEVSLGVTRFRRREGVEDLHQYVVEEEPPRPVTPPSNGPQVIRLDDPPIQPRRSSSSKISPKPSWEAPNIAIYLSKIKLPDLEPGRRQSIKGRQKSGQPLGPTSPPKSTPVPPIPTPGAPSPPPRPSEASGNERGISLGRLLKAAASKV